MPVVDIPDVGTVEFPETMAPDDIAKAASEIYDEHIGFPREKAASALQATMMAGAVDTVLDNLQPPSHSAIGRLSDISPDPLIKQPISESTVIRPNEPGDTYGEQLKALGITPEQAAKVQKGADLAAELSFMQAGKATKLVPGGIAKQIAIGLTKAAPDLSVALNQGIAALASPGTLPAGTTNRTSILSTMLGPYGLYLERVSPSYKRALKAIKDQFSGAAEEARPFSKALETVGEATEGSDAARRIAASAGSLAPSLAVAPAGLGAMVAAAGFHGFGGSYDSAKQDYIAKGQLKPEAERNATVDGIISGLTTALVTAAFGNTGVEAINKAIVTPGVMAGIRSWLREAGFETAEETLDQVGQSIIQKLRSRPEMTLDQAVKETVEAGIGGFVLGGAANAPRVAQQVGDKVSEVVSLSDWDKAFNQFSTMVAQDEALRLSLPPPDLVSAQAAVNGAPATAAAVQDAATTLKPESEVPSAIQQTAGAVLPDVPARPVQGAEAVPTEERPGANAPTPGEVQAAPSGGTEALTRGGETIERKEEGQEERVLTTPPAAESTPAAEPVLIKGPKRDPKQEQSILNGLNKRPEILVTDPRTGKSYKFSYDGVQDMSLIGGASDEMMLTPKEDTPWTAKFSTTLAVSLRKQGAIVPEQAAPDAPLESKIGETGEGAGLDFWVQKKTEVEAKIEQLEANPVRDNVTQGRTQDQKIQLNKLRAELKRVESNIAYFTDRPLESRISSTPSGPDPFTMEDEVLDEFFRAQFGETGATGLPGELGRPGMFTFPDYASFKAWMDARYVERDIEGMRLAFAEAPVENKKAYIKDHKAADAHKKAWIANLATGAALPPNSPPVARTTPRPVPGATTRPGGTTAPAGPPPTQQPPPAAPRQPSDRVKFDIMALTQLLRMFEKFPKINSRLFKAYGRYLPGVGEVELKERLMWDKALAERVLAHESGHFVDLFLSPQGKGLPFAERLSPLRNFKAYIQEKKAWRNEARSLSRAWRGPFVNGDPYRDTANELFADFMSAMFNDPEWVNQNYPILHDAFAELLAGKPSFRVAYDEMTRWLEGGTMIEEWRNQQSDASERTIKDLMVERVKHRQSFIDWMKGAVISTWYRAYGKEGSPTGIGGKLSDELEYSNLWAAKENAIFADDFMRLVQPELNKVNPDMTKARALMHQYAQARRTIGERRAAGVWIENHPTEARAILEQFLNLDPILRSKFLNDLNNAQNNQLYDLSGAVFREIHDRGDRFVKRMERAIDAMNVGVDGEAALLAFNVRGKLLNPGGLTVENAQKVLDEIKAEITPEQWTALETASKNLRDLFHNVQEDAYNEGLISKKTWDELIAPNRDNYLPYAVLDYWDGKVGGGIKIQKGTAKDIADITLATQLKTSTLNAWRQRQRQVQLLRDIYTKGGTPIPVGDRLRKPQDIDQIKRQHADDDISRAVLWQDGSPHLVEFPGDPGKSFEKAMDSGAFYSHMEWITNLSRLTHGMMQLYTTLSLPFMIYRNPVRGARTAALRTGVATVGKELLTPSAIAESLRLARNYARAAFGGEMLPEVRDLVDRQILLPPRLSSTMVRDVENLTDMLETGGILAFQLEKFKQSGWPFWKRLAPARKAIEFAEKVFTSYEAFEKIYNYHAALGKGMTSEAATGVARRSGIPKPGVGGHFSLPMEVFFPWTRVQMQGLRASLDTLRDPDLRAGYLTRFAIMEAFPRIAKVMLGVGLATGVFKWLMRPDEDEDDPVIAEVMRRISPYKMALDDIVPWKFYNPRTGKYHFFNEFQSGSAVPSHYEVVSWRIPSSEEGRTFGPLLYNLLSSMPGIKDKMAKPGDDPILAVGSWLQNEMLPGISPAIQTTENLYQMILRGKNPDDPFRGQPSANKVLFDAGGIDRAQAIAGYVMNQAGWPGDVAATMAMNFGMLDERASSALKQRMAGDKTALPERIPLAKNLLSYDNYAQYRDEGAARLAETELRAKARLAMSPEVRAIYDFYWRNYDRQDRLDLRDKQRFTVASDFHALWGRLDDRGSLYSKTAHAISDDGSKMSRETIRRDIDAASVGFVARWNFINELGD